MIRADWDAYVTARAAAKVAPHDKGLARAASRLRDRLVKDNTGLVKKFVLRLHKQSTQYAEIEDLMQAGMMGLVRALETFDPAHAAFSTYAFHWIRHFVQHSQADAPQIKRPKGAGVPYAVSQRQEKFRHQHGREALPDELGLVGKDPVTQADLDKWAAFPLVTAFEDGTRGNACGNANFDGNLMSRHETVDSGAPNPEEILSAREQGVAAIKALTERERMVLEELCVKETPIKDLAARMGFTAEGVRQIRERAEAKVRKALADDGEDT